MLSDFGKSDNKGAWQREEEVVSWEGHMLPLKVVWNWDTDIGLGDSGGDC